MKTRRAAMKEYLMAATKIAKEMNKSCQRTCTLAQVRIPVNPSARTLSGSGSKRVLQLNPKMVRLWLLQSLTFSSSSSSLEPLGGFFCCCCCCVLPCSLNSLLLLLFANLRNGCGLGERKRGWGLRERGEENGKEWERGIESESESEGFNPTIVLVIAVFFSHIQKFWDLRKCKCKEGNVGENTKLKLNTLIHFVRSTCQYITD